MADDLCFGEFLQKRTGSAGMIDMDMGKEDVVEPLNPAAPEFGNKVRNGRERTGIDQQGETLATVEPGADELAKAGQSRLIEVDAVWIFSIHGIPLSNVFNRILFAFTDQCCS
jgi:hypothetical protein